MNVITMPNDSSRVYVIVSNAEGKVDIIQKSNHATYKQLPITAMVCSLQLGNNLFIGSASKLYLIDLAQDFAILGHIGLTRHIFSICAMN